MEDVQLSSAKLGSISALLSRAQTALSEYVVEVRVQCPDLEMLPVDAPELTSSLGRLQVCFLLFDFCLFLAHQSSFFLLQ